VSAEQPAAVAAPPRPARLTSRAAAESLPLVWRPKTRRIATGRYPTAGAADESLHGLPADATALPFADGEFDAVVCQFGVMFFPEKDKGYREARRVLAAGGHYVFSVWDTREHNTFGRIVSDALRDAFDVDPPPFLDVPFGYAAIDPIKASLLANGFHGLRVDLVRQQGPIADFDAFAAGLVRGSPLVDQIRARGVEPEKLERAVVQSLRDEFGEVRSAPLQFILFDAWRE